MSFISVFDVMGPNMIGPSSSHTAGAARIALLARKLLTGSLKKVEFTLYGSFAKTYHGHGTDRALLGGIMGFATDDVRIRDSFQIATDNGIEYSFIPNNVETDVHPNTVDILMVNEEGQEMMIRGESLGGGKARLCAKRDVLRQCAVFHHGHFIEAKLHFLALLCFSEILRGGPRPHASRSARSTARCCVFYFLRHTRSARTSAAAPSDFSSHHTIFSRLCQESGRRGMHFVPQKHTFQADCSHPLKYCGMLYFVKLSGNRSFPLEFRNKDASRFYFLTGFPVQHGRSTADF